MPRGGDAAVYWRAASGPSICPRLQMPIAECCGRDALHGGGGGGRSLRAERASTAEKPEGRRSGLFCGRRRVATGDNDVVFAAYAPNR